VTNHERDSLSERLAALRAQSGLSLKQLGQRLHISDSSLSRYFTGQTLPPWEVVEALAKLVSADPLVLRAEWDAAQKVRRRAGKSGSVLPADGPPDSPAAVATPLWEPDWPATAPPPPSLGRSAAAGIGVVLLMAVSAAMAYVLSGTSTVVVTRDPLSGGSIGPLPAPQTPGGTPPSTSRPTSAPASGGTSSGPAVAARAHPAPRIGTDPVVAPTTKRHPEPGPTSSSVPPAGPVSGSIIAITNEAAGTGSVPYVLDVENWSMDNGARVHLWTWRTDGDYSNQLWVAELIDATTWRMVNKLSSKCLTRDDGNALVQDDCTDAPNQGWQLDPGGTLHSAAADHRCVEIKGRQRLLDAGLTIAACDGGWYQHWQLDTRQPPAA
jgi:transcriptional regulator with XRE-family HTH domain